MICIYRMNDFTPEPFKYPAIYEFCKKNGIDCEYDYNHRIGRAWTELYMDGQLIIQIGSNASVEQFIQLMQHMYDTIAHCKFKNLDVAVASVDGPDFEVCIDEDEEKEQLLKKLIDKHYSVFYNDKK